MPSFSNSASVALTVVLVAVAGALLAKNFPSRFRSPLSGGFARPIEITVSPRAGGGEEASARVTKVFETKGVKHSIALDEILSGGPPKDGIPSVDRPKFLPAAEALYLTDLDPGIGIVLKGEARFYPYRILVWHEIVNDTIRDEPVLVTYCPLCATGIVFERRVDGTAVEFGVSGKLWKSNLLMYDRRGDERRESLWSQVLGEAVVGPKTGTRLRLLPSEITRWGFWKKAHPQTHALSKETGAFRNYTQDPYGDYYASERVGFGATFRDTRLHPKALIFGVEVDGRHLAFAEEAVKRERRIEAAVGGRTVVAEWKADTRSVAVSIPAIPAFWFSWLAVHPETELFK